MTLSIEDPRIRTSARGRRHVTDHNTLHAWYNGTDFLIRYVDPVSGVDTNSGLQRELAFLTIQAAYDDLVSAAETLTGVTTNKRIDCGTIILLPGGHDLGADGLNLNRVRPCTIRGFRAQRWRTGLGLSAIPAEAKSEPYLYTSAGTPPSALINTVLPAATVNGYGFEFRDFTMWFDKSGIDFGIYAPCVNNLRVTNVGFVATETGPDKDIIAIHGKTDTALGDDTSWWRISDCVVSRLALCQIGESGNSGNHNQHVIRDNVAFGWGKTEATAKPLVAFYSVFRSSVRDNNLEAAEVGILLDENCQQNRMDGNAGESVKVFLRIADGQANMTTDMGSTIPTAGDLLVQIQGSAGGNLVMTPAITNQGGLYDKDAYEDTSSKANWIIAPSIEDAQSKLLLTMSSYTTSERDALDTKTLQLGMTVWDSTLAQPIWWTGSAWIDAAGAGV